MHGMRIVVTGGNGFVGSHLCSRLRDLGAHVRITARSSKTTHCSRSETYCTGDLTQFSNWQEVVAGANAVVHLVARTHMTDEFGAAAMDAYRATNVDVTRRIARAAKQAEVPKFLYLSSIKAVANASEFPLIESSACHPQDSYGVTKLEAEQTVRRQLLGSGTSYTILRPPLIYGTGVGGNFLRLLNLVRCGVPLPKIHNQRSLLYVENLVDAICLSLESDDANNETFHVADTEPISTCDLVRHLADGLDRTARLIAFPRLLLRQLGHAVGKQAEIQRLTESLVVSNQQIRTRLNWQPRFTSRHGITQTSRQFASHPWHTDRVVTPSRESHDNSHSKAA